MLFIKYNVDNADTIKCFYTVQEAILSVYGEDPEELSFITPRSISNTVESWATGDPDKVKVVQMIFEWLGQYRYFGTDQGLTIDEKHNLLMKTLSNAQRALDSILTKRDRGLEEAEFESFNRLTPEEQTEFLNNMPIRVRGEDHGKCNIEEYKLNMEWFLDMAIPGNQTKETRLLNLLKKMGYNYADEVNGYLYLFSFLSELMRYEFILCREITPYTEELISFKRYKHKPEDEVWIKRLNYYKDIGIKNKHRHSATLNSTKWAISFNDFAKLYRAILGLSNKAIVSPLK